METALDTVADMPKTSRSVSHHVILSVEVTDGLLKGLKIELDPGHNCVIGGRGAGKTTLQELVRYVLVGESENDGLVRSNLRSGRVRIWVQTKEGVRYRVEREWNKPIEIFGEDGTPKKDIPLDRLFQVDVYSQNAIEEIATDPIGQLELLDRFVDPQELRRIETDSARLLRALSENESELKGLDQDIADLEDDEREAPALEEKLGGLRGDDGKDAKAIEEAHREKAMREKEKRTLTEIASGLKKARVEFDDAGDGLRTRLENAIDADVLAGRNAKVFRVIAKQIGELGKAVEAATARLVEECGLAEVTLGEQSGSLEEIHRAQDSELRELLERTQVETARAKERAQVEQGLLAMTAVRRQLEEKRRTHRTLLKRRDEMLDKLNALRASRFALRKAVAEDLSGRLGGKIRVRVSQAGNNVRFKSALVGILSRGSFIEQAAQYLSPRILAEKAQSNEVEALARLAKIDEDRARRAIDKIRDSKKIYELQVLDLEDLPVIELLDGKFKPSNELSTGQRCSTILPILLLESERPLLIDQPEDNLDNTFLFDTVVKRLEQVEGRRQLLFATHSPSVVVLGRAERVFVMKSNGSHAWVDKAGTVDERRREIVDILEGGQEAFDLRKARYGR
jgi:energy-coupling factor transporter ATP-binding protein EcfA2